MLDHDSSAEDTDLTQGEPEICGDVFLHDEMPIEEPVLTDNDDKFQSNFDDSDEEMPTYPQENNQFAQGFQVAERIQQIPKYQKILQNALKLRKAQEAKNMTTT